MFSQTVEYSLRAMVVLAFRYSKPATVQQIAELTQVPRPYLSKMMQNLVHADLVRSRRGKGGGFVLAKDPAQVSILDIINAIEPIVRINSCPLEIAQHTSLCSLHSRLDQVYALVEQAYADCTLAELLVGCGENGPLCKSSPIVPLGIEIKSDDKLNARGHSENR